MSYVANLNSALTYFKVDRPELAHESLLRAYSEVPDSDKLEDNPEYLKILALLAKSTLLESKPEKAIDFIDQGLVVKNDHIDLMFLKILYLYDMKLFDEMLAFIGLFLIAQENSDENYSYEFSSSKSTNEIYKNLLPNAYVNSENRDEIEIILTKLSEASKSESLSKAIGEISQLKEDASWQLAEKK